MISPGQIRPRPDGVSRRRPVAPSLAQLRRSFRVNAPRASARIVVLLVWGICGFDVLDKLVLRPQSAPLLVALDAGFSLAVIAFLVLPAQWLPLAYLAMGAAAPLSLLAVILSSSDPGTMTVSALILVSLPAFVFTLWGPRIGTLLTATSLAVIGTGAALGRFPWSVTVVMAALVVACAVFLGWAANQAERVETDQVTGLGNRCGLERRLERVLSPGGDASRAPAALLLMDVDGLRDLNATRGLAGTDDLLQAAGSALATMTDEIPGSATAFHLGSGTFAVVIEDSQQATAATAERLRSALPGQLTASAGLATSGTGDTVGQVLVNAQISLARAKAAGRNCLDPLARDAALVHALRSALAAQQLTVLYQPITDLATGQVTGSEALVRWDHPTRGRLSPDIFIPIAEDSGLIHDLGELVLAEACRTVARAEDDGWLLDRLNVNVSGLELQRAGYHDRVLAVLAATGMDPRRLVLEITESCVAGGDPEVARTLASLRAHGIRIAIDDFGTGYSSLSRLASLPVDILKIDKSFLWAADDSGRLPLLAAITALANAFSLSVVAEGVESWDDVDLLRAIGCPYGQGYLFGRPGTYQDLLSSSPESADPAALHAADPAAVRAGGPEAGPRS